MLWSRSLLLLVFFSAPFEAVADYSAGNEAFLKGDYKAALGEFRPLANEGHEFAQASLGLMYASGRGVPKDYRQAVYWYRKAAVQGNSVAQNNLGVMYSGGQGVPEDHQKAVYWYRNAAVQGNAIAQNNLGIMYATGQGVSVDYVLAYAWSNLAADRGEGRAADMKKFLSTKMDQAQIAKARQLSRTLLKRAANEPLGAPAEPPVAAGPPAKEP